MRQFIWGTAFGVSWTLAFGAIAAVSPESVKALDRFAEALEKTNASYIHEVSVSDLIDNAIEGMVTRLDPHSSYIDAKSYSDKLKPHAGIGVELTIEYGMVRVISPIDGTPASAAGIRPGDAILAINSESTSGMSLNHVIDLLRGPEKSQISLVIGHALGDAPRTITLTRAIVAVDAVRTERMGDIGYIRFSGLDAQTTDALHQALRSLGKQIGPKLKGYIIDLRNNPGGLLDQAIQVSDEFLSSGNIVTIRGRNAADSQQYDARGGGLFSSGDTASGKPVIVLINQGTAAGAEIIAAALQDHKRAILLGTRTFGAGTVQTVIPLGDPKVGGALRLTTGQFFRPSGAAIQVGGVTPDIAVAQSDTDSEVATWPKFSEAQLHGHFPGEASRPTYDILRPESGKHYDDFQLTTALERLNAMSTAKP